MYTGKQTANGRKYQECPFILDKSTHRVSALSDIVVTEVLGNSNLTASVLYLEETLSWVITNLIIIDTAL